MPINNAGQYTYGVPQNNGYYSSGYGTLGAGNPYISGGPGYIGSMNNTGGSILPTGGLLSNSAKVQSNPGFDDSSGLPIHTSHVTKQDGTPEMTSSFYFNQAQEPGQSVDEWKNMSPFDKAQIHENAARLAMDNGDIYSARRSMDVAERLRTGTPDWANPEGGYKGLPEYGIIPGNERGILNNIDAEGFGKFISLFSPLPSFISSVFNANKSKPEVTASVTNAAGPMGYLQDDATSSIWNTVPATHSAVVNAGDGMVIDPVVASVPLAIQDEGSSSSSSSGGGVFDYAGEGPSNTGYDYWGL